MEKSRIKCHGEGALEDSSRMYHFSCVSSEEFKNVQDRFSFVMVLALFCFCCYIVSVRDLLFFVDI